ncbi:MAG: ion channel [Colwellia sp.]
MFLKFVSFLLSPTYFFADYRKENHRINGKSVSKLMKKFNSFYFFLSIALAITVASLPVHSTYYIKYNVLSLFLIVFLIWIYPLSRANEVIYSFLKDAIDKVNGKKSSSDLKYGERIQMAVKSYIELIINFAVIYYLLPKGYFDLPIKSFIDSLYFSGVTITTLGYGDISPKHSFPQLLTVYEVLCGFSLVIVSFTVYVGKSMEQNN